MLSVTPLLALLLAIVAAAPPAVAATGDQVDLPVSFEVANTNTSGFPCPADGARYVVRGHITGPRAALTARGPRAIAFHLYGWDTGEWNWRLRDVPGYDYAAELGELGHLSLTIDRLGYGASGRPAGFGSCIGAQADVAHQVIGQLRRGVYAVAGGEPVAFDRVALAGHDVGGLIAEIEAYSYRDIDALIEMIWADQGITPYAFGAGVRAAAACATSDGYAYFAGTDEEEIRRVLFNDADPDVVAAFLARRVPNPCADMSSAVAATNTNPPRLAAINVPVLVIGTPNDPVFTREGFEQQRGHFTGSSDVSLVFLERSGHYPMFERTAPEFRAVVSAWLSSRGFPPTASRHLRPTTRPRDLQPTPARAQRRTASARAGPTEVVTNG